MKIKKIILDTNVFIEAVKNKISLFDQTSDKFPGADTVSSAAVISELRRIARRKGSDATAAKLALQIFIPGVSVKKTAASDDDSLLELCGGESVLITQDKELRKRCAEMGFTTCYIRDRKLLSDGKKLKYPVFHI